MKKYTSELRAKAWQSLKIYILYALAVGFISYQYGGCSDDITSIINPTEMFGGYDETEAGKMMTLSALIPRRQLKRHAGARFNYNTAS
jgi:hypothetical protein